MSAKRNILEKANSTVLFAPKTQKLDENTAAISTEEVEGGLVSNKIIECGSKESIEPRLCSSALDNSPSIDKTRTQHKIIRINSRIEPKMST